MQPQEPMIINGAPIMSESQYQGRHQLNRRLLVVVVAAVALVALAIVGLVVWVHLHRDDGLFEQTAARVDATNGGFSPATVKIKKGQAVTWVDKDTVPHQVFADQETAPNLDSVDMLLTGDSYTYTFEKAGTYHYYDPSNATQYQGTVIVE